MTRRRSGRRNRSVPSEACERLANLKFFIQRFSKGFLLICVVKFFDRRGRDLLDRDIALGVDVAVSRCDSAGSKDDLFRWEIRVKGNVPLGYIGLKDTACSCWPCARDC